MFLYKRIYHNKDILTVLLMHEYIMSQPSVCLPTKQEMTKKIQYRSSLHRYQQQYRHYIR